MSLQVGPNHRDLEGSLSMVVRVGTRRKIMAHFCSLFDVCVLVKEIYK